MESLGPISKPAPHMVADRKEWIVSDREEDGCLGFAIYVRTSITNAEQQMLIDRNNDILRYQEEEWNALPPEAREYEKSPYRKQLELIAPHIHDWNAWGYILDGTKTEIAPPAVNGVAAFDAVTDPYRLFCTRTVLNGYLHLGKAVDLRSRSSPSGEASETSTLPETPAPKSSRRRKTSSMPSASTSTPSDLGSTPP